MLVNEDQCNIGSRRTLLRPAAAAEILLSLGGLPAVAAGCWVEVC